MKLKQEGWGWLRQIFSQGFTLSGLGALAEASLTCDRVVQF